MLKKIIFIVTTFLGGISCTFAENNLRDVVAVVYPVYDIGTTNFLKEFSKSLKRDGYRRSAELLDAYAKGGFGSGFVYKDDLSGRFYLITNRHVVTPANSVSIKFMSAEKAQPVRYDNCEVIAVHDELDIAIVALPEKVTFEHTLTFSDKSLKESADVYSAGFPGLGQNPSWQFGKGIISNSAIYIDDMPYGKDIPIIQHTAQIDPGSSGGPLLVPDENSPFGYDIVGINTWKARGRESANFAIPASVIVEFIKTSLSTKSKVSETDLQQKVNDMVEASNLDYKATLPYISYDYISGLSVETFYNFYKASSQSTREDIIKCFNNGMPIEGVRIALADAVVRNFSAIKTSFSGISDFSDNSATITFKQNRKNASATWLVEHNTWKMNSLSSLKTKGGGIEESGLIDKRYSYNIAIRFGLGQVIDNNYFKNSYTLGYGYSVGYWNSDASIHFLTVKETEIDEYDDRRIKNAFGANTGLGVQLPLRLLPALRIVPHIKGTIGFEVSDEVCYTYGYILGGDIAYKIADTKYLMLGLDYKNRYAFSSDDASLYPIAIFEISLGISF